MSIVLVGSTSGSITLQEPAIAGTTVLELPATSGTFITTTGGVAPSTSGNVLTSNGTTWTSAALPAGGVSSLNGQTGAITNTSLYAIGSYTIGRPASNTGYAVGDTVAGSSLYSASLDSYYNNSSGWAGYGLAVPAQTLVNTGTWRAMSPSPNAGVNAGSGLWVRIS